MTGKRYQRTRVQEIDAFQHATDDYWFRPVVIGKNLYTYVAYVPPGGFMAPHGHEEDPYELSFFMLRGTLDVMLDGDTFTAQSGDAVHIDPTVSLGVRNTSGEMATPITSVEGLRQRFIQRGYGLRTAAEMETLLQRGPG